MMQTTIKRPIHVRQIASDGTDTGPLCLGKGPSLKCFPYQVKHAVYSGADICDDCRTFYETHRDHFDNISPPWNEADEAMAFGKD